MEVCLPSTIFHWRKKSPWTCTFTCLTMFNSFILSVHHKRIKVKPFPAFLRCLVLHFCGNDMPSICSKHTVKACLSMVWFGYPFLLSQYSQRVNEGICYLLVPYRFTSSLRNSSSCPWTQKKTSDVISVWRMVVLISHCNFLLILPTYLRAR